MFCRRELPSVERLYQEFKGNGFVVLFVDLLEAPDAVQELGQALGLHFPLLLDRDGQVMRSYRVVSTPHAFWLDRAGRVVASHIGGRDWESSGARALVREMLKR